MYVLIQTLHFHERDSTEIGCVVESYVTLRHFTNRLFVTLYMEHICIDACMLLPFIKQILFGYIYAMFEAGLTHA